MHYEIIAIINLICLKKSCQELKGHGFCLHFQGNRVAKNFINSQFSDMASVVAAAGSVFYAKNYLGEKLTQNL